MSIASEAAKAPNPLAATLAAGVKTLSNNQKILFRTYSKFVMEQDGYVFWVQTPDTFEVLGSLHVATDQNQDETQTIAVNRLIFTALEEVTRFNEIDSQTLYVGAWEIDDVTLKVVFNSSGQTYKEANLWHYSGDAVYPALESQFVESEDDLPTEPIVSNSLPIWLGLTDFGPVYPSFLVPSNIKPPYIVVHIEPEKTKPLQQFANDVWPGTQIGENEYSVGSAQLMQDEVRLTFYGFNAQKARQYLSALEFYSLKTDDIGFCNSPAILDAKRTQSEIGAIAMKKFTTILVSYYNLVADAIARRLILSATVDIITT